MKIRYQNGTVIEGSTLFRTEDTMRVAVKGGDDIMQFTNIHGTWVSEDLEPVVLELGAAWRPIAQYSEEGFICSQELAGHLVRLLYTGTMADFLEEPGL